jgi:CRP-like cAMP-binding protein
MSEQNQEKNSEENTNLEDQKSKELKDFLTNVCDSLCLSAIESKPKDICIHMINYLKNKYGYSSSGLKFDEKKELEKLRSEVVIFKDMDEHAYYLELQKQVKKDTKVSEKKSKIPPKPKPRLPPDENIISEDEDYNNKDEIDENLDNIEYIQKCNLNNKRVAVTENTLSEQDEQSQIKMYKKNSELYEVMRINLMKSPIFSELSQDVLRQCIDAMEEKNIAGAIDVVKQGQISDCFYYIQEGELECKMQFIKVTQEGNRKKVEKFEPKLVKIYGPRDYFGELSLLYHNRSRGTVKTITEVKAYILKRTTYKKILKNANNESNAKKINIFKKTQILSTLNDDEYEKIQQISKEAVYYKGETIFKENEFCNTMLIVEKGKCIGTQTLEDGKLPEKIRDYREGDVIGETSLLKAEKIKENIVVDTDIVKFICLDRFNFRKNFGSLEPMLMRNMELYYSYFPPIIEEKPEEKNENKEEKEKEKEKQNESKKLNESPSTNNVNMSMEQMIKKIKDEVNEEKKKMEMKKNEEIEKLKKQIAELQNANNELMKNKGIASNGNQDNQSKPQKND